MFITGQNQPARGPGEQPQILIDGSIIASCNWYPQSKNQPGSYNNDRYKTASHNSYHRGLKQSTWYKAASRNFKASALILLGQAAKTIHQVQKAASHIVSPPKDPVSSRRPQFYCHKPQIFHRFTWYFQAGALIVLSQAVNQIHQVQRPHLPISPGQTHPRAR